jgi:ribosome-associated protein
LVTAQSEERAMTSEAPGAGSGATSVEQIEGRDRALHIADIISETPARDTVVLDIHELSPFADYFVITAGANERQLRAINRAVMDRMSESGIRAQRSEGAASSGWIVLDFGDVLVHIFSEELRDFYRLEDLWAEAPTLLAIQ